MIPKDFFTYLSGFPIGIRGPFQHELEFSRVDIFQSGRMHSYTPARHLKGLSSVILILTLSFTTGQAVLVSLHLRVCFWTASKSGCKSCALQLDCYPHLAFSKDGATNLPTPDIYARHCQPGSMSPRKAIFWILGCWKLIANTQAINSP